MDGAILWSIFLISAEMPDQIEVVPATPGRWTDIEQLFARIPCWCQYWRVSAGEYNRKPQDQALETWVSQRKAALRRQLDELPPPGMLAYKDGQIAGWCGLGPRPNLERLVRSRTVPLADNLPVWSIVCFLVRVGYRRHGVARALLQGIIDYARENGAPALEAYPVNPGGKRIDVAFAYVGTASMFEKAGFTRVLETSARSAGLPRWLMRLEFQET